MSGVAYVLVAQLPKIRHDMTDGDHCSADGHHPTDGRDLTDGHEVSGVMRPFETPQLFGMDLWKREAVVFSTPFRPQLVKQSRQMPDYYSYINWLFFSFVLYPLSHLLHVLSHRKLEP